jgi:hypothetical protein
MMIHSLSVNPVQLHEIALVESIIEGRVVPFDKATAVLGENAWVRRGQYSSQAAIA